MEITFLRRMVYFSFTLTFMKVKQEETHGQVYISKEGGDGRNSILETVLLVLSKLLREEVSCSCDLFATFRKARNSPSRVRPLCFIVQSLYHEFIGAMLHWSLVDNTNVLSIP